MESEIQLNRETYQQWLQSPVTQQVLKKCEKELLRVSKGLATGVTLDNDNIHRTAQKTAKAVGYCKGVTFFANFKMDKSEEPAGKEARSEQG